MSIALNNGTKVFTLLVEMNARTGEPTGRIKPNIPSDPNYKPPVVDLEACPIGEDPVFTYYNVNVVIPDSFDATIKLGFGSSEIQTDTSGSWNIVDRVYDHAIFQVAEPVISPYIVQVICQPNSVTEVSVVGGGSILVTGPFEDITDLIIISNPGDYNGDFNNDYYN